MEFCHRTLSNGLAIVGEVNKSVQSAAVGPYITSPFPGSTADRRLYAVSSLGQADFLTDAVSRLTIDRGLDLHLVGWPWLHDLDAGDDAGLIEDDGTEKLAYAVWAGL